MHCVNKSHPEYKKLLKESGLNPIILNARISIWQEENGLDKFPTVSDLSFNLNNINYNFKLADKLISNQSSPTLTPQQKEAISNLKQNDSRWNKYSDEDIQRFIDSVFNKFVIDNINENLYQKVVSSLINQKIIERQC